MQLCSGAHAVAMTIARAVAMTTLAVTVAALLARVWVADGREMVLKLNF